jgi:arylsulfatase A-like enzyme
MGQKDWLFKNSPWEEATRIPFIVRAPGVAQPGGVAEQPVSLIDLYPTLVDLCGLKGDTRKNAKGAPLDGFSVRPLLEDPSAGKWDGPEGALTMIFANENSVTPLSPEDRTNPTFQHMEELYDHQDDPNEWTNLANSPEYETIKATLKHQILEMTGQKK